LSEWQEYQVEVAEFLCDVGFAAEVDKTMSGARGIHDIDVVATYEKSGLSLTWIVECKRHQRRIDKADVLAFVSIVQDLGVDRGLFVADSGFQSGAIASAMNTNITLTTLPDLRANANHELLERLLVKADQITAELSDRMHSIGVRTVEPSDRFTLRTHSYVQVDEIDLIDLIGRISVLRSALDKGRLGRWPVSVISVESDARETKSDPAELWEFTSRFLRHVIPSVCILERANQTPGNLSGH
jgi:hypothetical protein